MIIKKPKFLKNLTENKFSFKKKKIKKLIFYLLDKNQYLSRISKYLFKVKK